MAHMEDGQSIPDRRSRRAFDSQRTDMGAEMAVLGLCLVAGIAGLLTSSPIITATLFLGGIGTWLAVTLPTSLQGWLNAARKHRVAAEQQQLLRQRANLPEPEQLLMLMQMAQQSPDTLPDFGDIAVTMSRKSLEQVVDAGRLALTVGPAGAGWRFLVLEDAACDRLLQAAPSVVNRADTKHTSSILNIAGLGVCREPPKASCCVLVCAHQQQHFKYGSQLLSAVLHSMTVMAVAQGWSCTSRHYQDWDVGDLRAVRSAVPVDPFEMILACVKLRADVLRPPFKPGQELASKVDWFD